MKQTLLYSIFFLLLIHCFNGHAQIERAYHWPISNNWEIDFSGGGNGVLQTGTIILDNGSGGVCMQGVGSLSDVNGNLLAHYNGYSVRDAANALLTTTVYDNFEVNMHRNQEGILIPDPAAPSASDCDVFIWALGIGRLGGGGKQSHWAQKINLTTGANVGAAVDMHPTDGSTSESMAVTINAARDGYWVLSKSQSTPSRFFATLIDASGVNAPVISNLATTASSATNYSFLKFSPQGDKMALSWNGGGELDVWSFNNATGTFGGKLFTTQWNSASYAATPSTHYPGGAPDYFGAWPDGSLAFSADGEYIFLMEDSGPASDCIFRYHIATGITSRTLVCMNCIDPFPSSMQLGPDGRIYFQNRTGGATRGPGTHVINNPTGVPTTATMTGLTSGTWALPNYPSNYFVGAGSGGPGVGLDVCYPLPLNLLSFNAKLNNDNEVDLFWVISNDDKDLNYIEVERSDNGSKFDFFTRVQGLDAGGMEKYTSLDEKPYLGISYYRLKVFSKDGSFLYSKPVMIKHSSTIAVSAFYPNPATQAVNFNIRSIDKSAFSISIFDVLGKQVHVQSAQINSGDNLVKIDLSGFAKGSYLVAIQSQDGAFKTTRKLSIQ